MVYRYLYKNSLLPSYPIGLKNKKMLSFIRTTTNSVKTSWRPVKQFGRQITDVVSEIFLAYPNFPMLTFPNPLLFFLVSRLANIWKNVRFLWQEYSVLTKACILVSKLTQKKIWRDSNQLFAPNNICEHSWYPRSPQISEK